MHCVQFWDKAPSAEERPGWLSGPSCSALSPGGGWGWAGNTGRVHRGSQRKGEGGKIFNRPSPSRHSSSLSLCANVVTGKPMVRHVPEVPRYWGQHIQWESQSSQQRDDGKGSPECTWNFSTQQNPVKRNTELYLVNLLWLFCRASWATLCLPTSKERLKVWRQHLSNVLSSRWSVTCEF